MEAKTSQRHLSMPEPKKDKLENGGEMMRPERPNTLTAGKHARRICYQGDVVGGYGTVGDGGGVSDEQLMLSDLPEPPIAVSDIGPIPPPPMFSSPSPTRHHHTNTPHHSHQHALVQHSLSDSEDEDDQDDDEEQLTDTNRVEEIPPKEPIFNAVPLKSALKKRPAPAASPTRPVRMGNTHENKENARPWEEHRDDYTNESAAAKLARKESLNIKLALRPDRQELINRTLYMNLHDSNTPKSESSCGYPAHYNSQETVRLAMTS
ncbi:putative neural crest cell migration [Operophtera brumata]|uniref:Putative neural crest cell migration n=1 Tax=Operophtera brumata TaxID=104452 RepID=A0A0L7LQ06_OPEBR|nr:putative neural crest cell migration [Operophtera brumata]